MRARPGGRGGVRALVLLLGLMSVSACGGEVAADLVRVPTEKEANEILAKLSVRGAEKTSKTEQRTSFWQITVPPDELDSARRRLVELRLPRDDHPGYEDLLASTGLIPNKVDERAKLMHAVAGELAATLETHPRILAARVHVALPDKELNVDPVAMSTKPRTRPTASVLIHHEGPATVRDGQPLRVIAEDFALAAADAEQIAGQLQKEEVTVDAAAVAAVWDRLAAMAPARWRLAAAGGAGGDSEDESDPAWPLRPDAVCLLVANAVENLSPGDVTVVYSAVRSFGGGATAPSGGAPAAAPTVAGVAADYDTLAADDRRAFLERVGVDAAAGGDGPSQEDYAKLESNFLLLVVFAGVLVIVVVFLTLRLLKDGRG
ncbi:MAG: hypothetical protein AAF628_22930 [Planctomycetota bacterium]